MVYFLYTLSGRGVTGTSGGSIELSDYDSGADRYGNNELLVVG